MFITVETKLCYIINIISPRCKLFKTGQNHTISGHRTKCSNPGRLATLKLTEFIAKIIQSFRNLSKELAKSLN